MDNEIQLKSISQLSGMKFVIPDYQRGYRWDKTQVEQLLDDIREFSSPRNKKDTGEFYCLQPVVVRRRPSGEYELIDGQQRLTTIFIILKSLAGAIGLLYPKFKLYELDYETRPESKTFLENMNKDIADSNIDFYFMRQAYDIVKEWQDGGRIDVGSFLSALLSSVIVDGGNGVEEDIANKKVLTNTIEPVFADGRQRCRTHRIVYSLEHRQNSSYKFRTDKGFAAQPQEF